MKDEYAMIAIASCVVNLKRFATELQNINASSEVQVAELGAKFKEIMMEASEGLHWTKNVN